MIVPILVLSCAGLSPGVEPHQNAIIQGVVVNGSKSARPVAGAEVVLLAGKDNQFARVANATSDANGFFVFDLGRLLLSSDLTYQPGANWNGVHYPGSRFRLNPHEMSPTVRLVVYDTIAVPSPLVAEVHEINVRVSPGVINVTEIIVVDNPSTATYVGGAATNESMTAPTTLSMAIPDGVSHITFNREFDAQNFQLVEGRLVTNAPWPPGKRQLAFIYQLPLENKELMFKRALDLPCNHARVTVSGEGIQEITCNLTRVTSSDVVPIIFDSAGQLAAGSLLQLQLHDASISWIVFARWGAIILLGVLLAATIIRLALRSKPGARRQPTGTPERSRTRHMAA